MFSEENRPNCGPIITHSVTTFTGNCLTVMKAMMKVWAQSRRYGAKCKTKYFSNNAGTRIKSDLQYVHASLSPVHARRVLKTSTSFNSNHMISTQPVI